MAAVRDRVKANWLPDGKSFWYRVQTGPKAHEYVLGIEKATASELTIAVRVTDEWDNQTVVKTVVR